MLKKYLHLFSNLPIFNQNLMFLITLTDFGIRSCKLWFFIVSIPLTNTLHSFQDGVELCWRKKNVPIEAVLGGMGAEHLRQFAEGSLQRINVNPWSHSPKMWNLLSHLKDKSHSKWDSFSKLIYWNIICTPFLIKERSWITGEGIITVVWPDRGTATGKKIQ